MIFFVRVKLTFPYDEEIVDLVKKIPGRRWSQSMRCWHIPYLDNYTVFIKKAFLSNRNINAIFQDGNLNQQESEIKASPQTKKTASKQKIYGAPILLTINRNTKNIYLAHEYNPQLYKQMQELCCGVWDKKNRRWVFPGNNTIYKTLISIIKNSGISWKREEVQETEQNEIKKELTKKIDRERSFSKHTGFKKPLTLNKAEKEVLSVYVDSMQLKRLSNNTQKIYRGFFELYLSENSGKDIAEYDYQTIYAYLKAKSKKLNYTQLKQTIAAIKFYYEKNLGRDTMFFQLGDNFKVKKHPLHLPFYDFKDMCGSISSPSDRLLLFLVYHVNMGLKDIALMPLESLDYFKTYPMPGRNEEAIGYYKMLLKLHRESCNNKSLLFEYNAKPHIETSLRHRLYQILGYYKLEAIYKKYYSQLLDSTPYSQKTKQMYLSAFMIFLRHYNFKHPEFINNVEIRDYLVLHRHKSASHQDNMINSIKFFFEKVHNQELSNQHILRPRKGYFLPDYFTQEEIAGLIGNIDNLKHKLLLSICYCAGLRRREVQELKLSNIDLTNNRVFIQRSKGNRDRYSLFSGKLHDLIKAYLEKFKPKVFLFEGISPATRYSTTSMAKVLESAAKKASLINSCV